MSSEKKSDRTCAHAKARETSCVTSERVRPRMVVNLEKWRDQWILDVKPSEEAIAKKEESLAKHHGCSNWNMQCFDRGLG